MSRWVCPDASLALKWFLPEPGSDTALSLLRRWNRAGVSLAAPHLLAFEVASVLRNRVVRGLLTPQEGERKLNLFAALPIRLQTPPGLVLDAFRLAGELGRPTAYDAAYLALARSMECEFWTADARLVRALGGRFTWVKHLDDMPDQSLG